MDLKGLKEEKLRSLKNEISMAMALNREELEPVLQENIQRYIGNYVPAFGGDWDIVLNEVYPIIQYMMPSIFFRNPRAFLKPRNKTFIAKRRNPVSGSMEEIQLDSSKSAKTQEDILNYTINEMDYKKECRKTLLDALLFPFGIMWHGYKGDFGMTEESSWIIKDDKVFVKRVSPLRFLKDPGVNMANMDEARWVARIIDVPYDDLIEDDKLDVDKKLVKGKLGYGNQIGSNTEMEMKKYQGQDYARINAGRRAMIEFADKGFKESKEARFVQVYEIYLRPSKKEKREGKKGWVLLLCDEQDKPLRVNTWEVKAEGFPAQVLQFNELPDSMFGLTDVETYKQIADMKNVVTNLQLRNGQENCRNIVAVAKGMSNEEEIEHVQRGDQSIIAIEGDTVEGKVKVMTMGGAASSELYVLGPLIDRQLQEKSGVTDLKKGFIQSGEESATSVRERSAGGAARPAYRQDLMAEFLKKSFHYINQLNKQFMPVKDAVRIVGSLDLEWSDNPSKEEIQADVDVDIDVISMLPENPEKEMQELQTILTMMYQAMTQPIIAQKLAQEGKTINLSPIIEQLLMRLRIKDPDVFRNIRPEESQGFVSVQQIREAKQNVDAALSQPQGTPVPFPPKEGDDHVAKLEIYTSIKALLDKAGQISDTLEQLIQMQAALLQELQEKQAEPNKPVKLEKPTGV